MHLGKVPMTPRHMVQKKQQNFKWIVFQIAINRDVKLWSEAKVWCQTMDVGWFADARHDDHHRSRKSSLQDPLQMLVKTPLMDFAETHLSVWSNKSGWFNCPDNGLRVMPFQAKQIIPHNKQKIFCFLSKISEISFYLWIVLFVIHSVHHFSIAKRYLKWFLVFL